jgi:hypothetical protein
MPLWTGGVVVKKEIIGGYRFGNELLILNGLLTFIGLWLISKRKETPAVALQN